MANTITITGNAGRDPELSFAASGLAICKFGVAVYQGKDKPAAWTDVVVFDKMAENVAETIQKGDNVIVVGRLTRDEWEDKETGDKRHKYSVIADEVGLSMRFVTAQISRTVREH